VILPSIERRHAAEIVSRFAGLRILVAGDIMLDRFLVGRVTRISPEAPVPVVRFDSEYVRLGGAANVANNLAALGAQVALVGIVGTDRAAAAVRDELSKAGIGSEGLVEDPARPTTEKVRIVTDRKQQVARIDYERDEEVSGDIEKAIGGRIRRCAGGAHGLLVSDYLKGVVTRRLVEEMVVLKGMRPLVVDPKIPHLACYAGATLVTPNLQEAETATHRRIRSDDDARAAARQFREAAHCESVLITRGEAGMWLCDEHTEGSIPAVAREVADVTGAGDTVAATLVVALAAGATVAEAAILANYAAGIVVGKFGPATVTPDELRATLGTARVFDGPP
jgi:rfaE bifunctional protein kinase chain/domain